MKLIVYGKTNWEKDFLSALEDQVEVKKYISAFHSALNPMLRELVDRDEHIMRACSLLAILPLPPGTSLRHLEIPMDLTAMRLPDWVNKNSRPGHQGGHVATHFRGDWDGNTIIRASKTRKSIQSQGL